MQILRKINIFYSTIIGMGPLPTKLQEYVTKYKEIHKWDGKVFLQLAISFSSHN